MNVRLVNGVPVVSLESPEPSRRAEGANALSEFLESTTKAMENASALMVRAEKEVLRLRAENEALKSSLASAEELIALLKGIPQ